MKQKTKNKKIKKNKTLKRALAFFCFFIFAFSLLNLNLTSLDFSNSDFNQACTFSTTFSTNRALADTGSGGYTGVAGVGKAIADATTGDGSVNPIVRGFNWILYGFFKLLAYLLKAAGLLFDWAIDADNIKDVIHRQAIYDAWKMVRDFLNLGFILILLYSAFCTIFQIEKYHLKKILLMLVLMALLVNFSFPISRFIVDASNVTMYYFLNSAFNQEETKSFSAGLTGPTGIADILVPRNDDKSFDSGGSTTQIMMAIFFVFCLMITMFVIAAIFVIRIVALAVLIIFSSIGFVAAVFPDTKSFANQWWSALFKYAFVGPILVFMLLIAYNLMKEMAIEGTLESMHQYAQDYGREPSALANSAYFFLPIVILWMGIIATQKMGIAGSDWVVGKATGARNWFAKLPVNTAKSAAIGTGVPGGVKQAWEGRKGVSIGIPRTKFQTRLFSGKVEKGKRTEEREAKIVGGLTGGPSGWKVAGTKIKYKQAQDRAEENKKNNVNTSQLTLDLDSDDEVTKMAAAITLAEKGLLTDINRFKKALGAAGGNEDLMSKIINKAPKNFSSVVKDDSDLDDALNSTTVRDNSGNIDHTATDRLKDSIKNKLKEDNNSALLAEHDVNFGGILPSHAYADQFDNMSAEQLAKQKGVTDDAYLVAHPDLMAYLRAKNNQFKIDTLDKMSSAGRSAWNTRHIV